MSSELKMSKEITQFDINIPISLENSGDIKEEFPDEYLENKVYVSETTITDTINVSNSELIEYIKNSEIRKNEILSPNHTKTDLPSPEVNDPVNNNVKIEDGICPANIQIQIDNEQLFCNHCHEVYQDYCTKCRVLVHILNKRPSHSTCNRIRELPKYMLEARELIEHLGIFSLKVIPEDVRFGPFTGLTSTELPLRIKGGRFVVSDDTLEHLNWMQYVNPARNMYEQNLFPFQYEDKLYYCTTRRIQEGEELLVYFGKQYEDNLLKNVEMDFVPITKKDFENVFACTFCCLGFSSKAYLTEHKGVSHSEVKDMFSVEELTQCQFCKVYLETKEYFDHHMDYCRDTNDRYWVLPSAEVHELGVEIRSSERRQAKKWKREIYKCTQCKFGTMYKAHLRQHTNEHCEMKMYKCGICHRRYKAKDSFKVHVEKNHPNNEGRYIQKYSTREYSKTNTKNIKKRRKFQARDKSHLKSLIKMKHLNRGKLRCANCGFKTYYRRNLERHMKITHLMESNYKCSECEFETNYKSSLVVHKNGKHLRENDYKCTECEYKTSYKSNLQVHIKAKHLKENVYKCAECEFKTNYKSNLQVHIKSKHLDENNYKCAECKFKTNNNSHLKEHIKTKHLKQKDYKCAECEYMAYRKSTLQVHIQTKHLKQKNYKCTECEFKTNYKSYLQIHIEAKHLKQKDYNCTECEFKTNYKCSLEAHIKAKHLKESGYKCTECEFKTKYKSNLQVHIKAKHLKENGYKCTLCEFKTNYKSHLKEHIKVKHLKQKDYKCTECEYMANRKSNLRKHVKAKHLK